MTIPRSQQYLLEKAATNLLHRNGFTWAGRPKKAIDPNQCRFEERLVRVPMGGLPKRSKP
jgi:hypothetical protein